MNLKKLLASIAKAATPVVKAAAPIIITAVVLHQPAKKVIGQIVRDELDKAGA